MASRRPAADAKADAKEEEDPEAEDDEDEAAVGVDVTEEEEEAGGWCTCEGGESDDDMIVCEGGLCGVRTDSVELHALIACALNCTP